MSDPDMYYNYTPTFAAAESSKQQLGAVSRAAFPQTVHVPEGKTSVRELVFSASQLDQHLPNIS